MKSKHEIGGIDTRWIILGALALAIVVAVPYFKSKVAYDSNRPISNKQLEETTKPVDTTEAATDSGGAIENILDNPEMYENQSVTINGIIDNQYTSNIYSAAPLQLLSSEHLLIISRNDNTDSESDVRNITAGSQVIASGTVRKMTEDLRKEFPVAFFSDDLYLEFKDQPVLIAKSIVRQAGESE